MKEVAMIFGMTPMLFLHVVLSLVGIATGFVVMAGLLGSNPSKGWTAWFLATTVLTSATGFLLPAKMLLPSHIVGIISLVLLAIALYALYGRQLSGVWRGSYVVTALLSLYLNVFVLIVQAFQKIAPLKALAPTQSEQPFLIAQGVTLAIFGMVIVFAALRFRPASVRVT
jgi:hypothetical protein